LTSHITGYQLRSFQNRGYPDAGFSCCSTDLRQGYAAQAQDHDEARKLVDEMLRQRRFTILREIKARLDGVKNFEDAIEAIGALRELRRDRSMTAVDQQKEE
jgi:hypothetical protein